MIDIETERLTIRNFTPDDWHALYDIAMKYEESGYTKYDHGPWPDSPDQYETIADRWSKSDDFLAVVLKENQQLIGFIALPRKQNAEYGFGFVFHPAFHSRDYTTESGRAVIKHAFVVFEADRITPGTAKDNAPSCKLLQQLGFIRGSEVVTSLRKDEDTNPIEFIGLEFLLSREEWKTNQDKNRPSTK
jgi:RimJ/RimL family protein N-acetyltransferase